MNQWTESLWGDEAFSALAVQHPFGEMIGIVMRDTAPPGFYLLGWLWGQLFGFSEIALRSLTLLLMLGAAVFAGLIVWEIGKNKLNALLTGLLAFSAPFLVPFAFEWRMYALLTFTIMGSVYFFAARNWRWYVVLTLAAVYTHHFGLFTFFGQGVWFLVSGFDWKKRQTWLKQLWPFLAVGLLYLPWLPFFYTQLKRVQGSGFWLGPPTPTELKDMMLRFVAGGVKTEWRRFVQILALGLLLVKDWRLVGRRWLGLALIFLMPVALAYVISHTVTPIFYDRYLLSVVMGLMVLLGLGTKRQFWLLLLIPALLFAAQSWDQFTHPSKRPFRELAGYVKQEIKPDDILLNYNGRAHHLWESKYYGIPAPVFTPSGPLPLFAGTAQMTPEDTTQVLPTADGRLGLIASEPIATIALPGYKLIDNRQFGQLSFSWWQRLKKPGPTP